MSARREKEINLLPQKGFESTTAGRVLAWILSTFRVIVIVTEIIVMIAFMSRFWLDAQNTDLNEKISQKVAVLSASQDFESHFKDTQQRLDALSDISSGELVNTNLLKIITKNLPPDVILNNISYANKKVALLGSTPNERSVQQLIVNLDANEEFQNVSFSEAKSSSNDPNILDFKIELDL